MDYEKKYEKDEQEHSEVDIINTDNYIQYVYKN